MRQASTWPPKSSAYDEPVVVPLLPKIELTPLEAAMVGSVRPGSVRPPLPSYAKWMIAVPWALLAVVVVGFAIAWPRAAERATVAPEPVYALAPIPPTASAPGIEPIGFEPSDVVIEDPTMTFVLSDEEAAAPTEEATGVPATPTVASVAPLAPLAVDPAVVDPAAVVAEIPVEPAPAVALVAVAPPVEAVVAPEVASTAADIRSHLSGTTTTSTASTAASASPVVPERPSRSEVSRALRAVAPAVDACTSNVGTATIHIVVNHDGSVGSASATGEYANTSEGACMANAVRGARFAPFTQPTLSVTYPFALR